MEHYKFRCLIIVIDLHCSGTWRRVKWATNTYVTFDNLHLGILLLLWMREYEITSPETKIWFDFKVSIFPLDDCPITYFFPELFSSSVSIITVGENFSLLRFKLVKPLETRCLSLAFLLFCLLCWMFMTSLRTLFLLWLGFNKLYIWLADMSFWRAS